MEHAASTIERAEQQVNELGAGRAGESSCEWSEHGRNSIMTREKDILRNKFNGTISYILISHAHISNRLSHHLLELGSA